MRLKTSFNAVRRSVKFIHIGMIKSISIVALRFMPLRARKYAVGYARRRQTTVVISAIAKLYTSVPSVLGFVKNSVKFSIVNCP